MAGAKIALSSTSGEFKTDGNDNARVNLPTTATQSGFSRLTYLPGSGLSKDAIVSEEGGLYVAPSSVICDIKFNSTSTAWHTKIGTNATTLTKGVTNGFMVLNSAAATTTTTGISIYSWQNFTIEEGRELRVKIYAKHLNATATNKQFDLGLGYYAFAAGQAAAMNEFIGFRWTTTAGFQAVLETSQGGAPTSQTTNLNGNVPLSDNIVREYELCITGSSVEYWIDGTYYARIARDPGSWGTLKSISLPFIARVFNSGAASAGATLSVGSVTVIERMNLNRPYPLIQAVQRKSTLHWQPDLTTATTIPHQWPASGTAPTANVGSNTASAANSTAILGGLIANTLTGVTVTLSTNILWTAYQNVAVPTAAGVATNARNLVVTGLSISPMVVTAALTGGGFTAIWFVGVGASAVSLATADADGTTAVAQTAPRIMPLNLTQTLAAAAALGAVSTDVGDHSYTFETPLVVPPGQFLSIGFRTIAVTAAVTVGAATAAIGVRGFWE